MKRDLAPAYGRRLRLRRRMADPFDRIRQNMEQLFAERLETPPQSWFGTDDDGAFHASLDIGETPEDLKITIDVPGIEEKDIDISLSDHALTVKGEREAREEEEKEDYHRVERSYGAFERRVTLPCDVDADRVKADLDKGVLTITLPKSEKARASERKIAVTSH